MFAPHLKYFVALARERHFARAAKACDIAQPTLSVAIRKLEEMFQVPLVVRGNRFVNLTDEGSKVLDWAQRVLRDYDSLKQELGVLRNELSGELRLGVIPSAMPVVAHLTGRLCEKHPGISVSIQSVSSRILDRGLNAFDFDGGVTYLDNEPLNHVRCVPLYQERYVFMVRRDSPFAARKTIAWREAVKENLCLLSEDMQNRRIINDVVGSLGLSVSPSVTCNSFAGIWAHVGNGGWTSIVPGAFGHLFADRQTFAMIDLVEPAHAQTVGLVLPSRDLVSPIEQALMVCAETLEKSQL